MNSSFEREQPWYVGHLQQVEEWSRTLPARSDFSDRKIYLSTGNLGGVTFSAPGGIPLDLLLIDGIKLTQDKEVLEVYAEVFTAIRSRLGLAESPSEYHPSRADLGHLHDVDYTGQRISMGMERIRASDAEAMFLIALPLASKERPVEKVLEEVRECARLGITQELVRQLAESGAETEESSELTPREKFAQAIFEIIKVDGSYNSPREIMDAMFVSGAVRTFVEMFASYKNLIDAIARVPKEDKEKRAGLAQLIALKEQSLLTMQTLAQNALKLGKPIKDDEVAWADSDSVNPDNYSITMARVAAPGNGVYVSGFMFEPVNELGSRYMPAEKAKLQLVIVPADYAERRKQAERKVWKEIGDSWD